MNGIESAKQAGPGWVAASPGGFEWKVDEAGDLYGVDYDSAIQDDRFYPKISVLHEEGWTIVRKGPEKPKAEPYKTPLRIEYSGALAWLVTQEGQRLLNNDNGDYLRKIAARLNSTIEAARREGIEQGWLAAKDELDPPMPPAVAKLVQALERDRGMHSQGDNTWLTQNALGEYYSATKSESKTCPGCGGTHPYSVCPQCDTPKRKTYVFEAMKDPRDAYPELWCNSKWVDVLYGMELVKAHDLAKSLNAITEPLSC